MDSFFSLFDPSDGKQSSKKSQRMEQDNFKKKGDNHEKKGRRRGRRGHTKNETLPEESSFLCEPDLSTDLLVKDGSYIDNYFEVNRRVEETKAEQEKKPKRRNSGRKNRRKKYKTSPMKDIPSNGNVWGEDSGELVTNWNNMSMIQKSCNETVGKNVNDLSSFKNNKEFDSHYETSVCEVIDKLEKVALKDDTYLAGDFDARELEKDFSSDDVEDSFEDTGSEEDDSSEEVYGSLPPEPRFGNVEYKLQLVAPCERRFQHLVTQLKWRLRSGGGSAVYVLGVRDCGALRGLRARALRASLLALRRMAAALSATVAHVTVRRVAPQRAVAEAYVTKLADTQQSVELRVAVMGANEAGKSTLIGVLTQGELDNGRGSARLNMFRHLHEVKSGRTSSLSHEILGFDAQGNVVNYGCSELMTAERIGERSAKLVSFLDLAGHTKYQRTTLHGLSGYCPHYAMLVISATAGITRITEEHLALLVALDLPFFVVITKCDIAGSSIHALVQQLATKLAQDDKKPLLITDENLARECVAPQRLILDSLSEERVSQKDQEGITRVPVFPVSCVKGVGLNALHAYLLTIQPPANRQRENESCEFQIDEIFHVGGGGGPVVGGLARRGQLREGDRLIIGPFETGEFKPISVCTIYRNRARCGGVRAGQCASLGLNSLSSGRLRPGMVLLSPPVSPAVAVSPADAAPARAADRPAFGRCPPGRCKSRVLQTKDLPPTRTSRTKDKKDRKSVRRKNKNLLQVIADAENSLAKTIDNDPNIYRSDSDTEMSAVDKIDDNVYRSEKDALKVPSESLSCVCEDAVPLEDPSDPRGCMYFQASVHVLRHSTAIYPGFQCTVHVGNVRQTAIIEGILSRNSEVRAGSSAPLVFRFTRCPEYLAPGRRLLLTAGQGTRAIGRVTQVFPYVP